MLLYLQMQKNAAAAAAFRDLSGDEEEGDAVTEATEATASDSVSTFAAAPAKKKTKRAMGEEGEETRLNDLMVNSQ